MQNLLCMRSHVLYIIMSDYIVRAIEEEKQAAQKERKELIANYEQHQHWKKINKGGGKRYST